MSIYHFGSFILDVRERRVLRDGCPISLTPKVFDTLVYLVERHGHLVGKDELLSAIWGGAAIEEGSLARAIHVLRRALTAGDGGDLLQPQYIETVPTKRYRFVAEVTRVDGHSQPTGIAVAASRPDREARSQAGPTFTGRAQLVGCCLLALALIGLAWRASYQLGTPTLPASLRPTPQTGSGGAYARFLSGRLHLERHHPGDVDAALVDFEAAIQLDPAFAAAHAGKADAKIFSYWTTGAHDDIAQARLAIRKALESDRTSSYAHALLCRLLGTYDWDFAEAEIQCRRAIALDSRNHEARRELAFLMNTIRRRDEALTEIDAAIAIAPTSFNKSSRGLLLYFNRRFDEAIAQLKQVVATDPEYLEGSRWLARCFEQRREYGHALEVLVRFREFAGARPEATARLREAFGAGGWPNVLRASTATGRREPNLDTAGTLAQLGELDAAFEVLESMIRARRVMIVHMDSEPRLDPLRSDQRFDQLARRVGLR